MDTLALALLTKAKLSAGDNIPAGTDAVFKGTPPTYGMPDTGWTQTGIHVESSTSQVAAAGGPISTHTRCDGAIQSNGKIILSSVNGSGTGNARWELNGSSWTSKLAFTGTGYGFVPGCALLPNGNILEVGATQHTKQCQVYNPSANTHAWTGNTNQFRNYVAGNVVTLTNGIVMCYGGNDQGGVYNYITESYDYSTGVWTPRASIVDGGSNVEFYGRACSAPNAQAYLLANDRRLFLHDWATDEITKVATLDATFSGSSTIGVGTGGLAYLDGYLLVVDAWYTRLRVYEIASGYDCVVDVALPLTWGSNFYFFKEDPANNRVLFGGSANTPVYALTIDNLWLKATKL